MHLPIGTPVCATEADLKYLIQQMPNGCQNITQDMQAWWVDSGLLGFLGTEGGMYAVVRVQTEEEPSGLNVFVLSGAVYNVGDEPK